MSYNQLEEIELENHYLPLLKKITEEDKQFERRLLLNNVTIDEVYNFAINSALYHLGKKKSIPSPEPNENENDNISKRVEIPKIEKEFIGKIMKWHLSLGDTLAHHKVQSRTDFLYKKCVLSPNLTHIARLDFDRNLYVFDLNLKKELFSINGKFIDQNNIRFSYDSKFLCFYDSQNEEVNVWDISNPNSLSHKYIKIQPDLMIFSKVGNILGIVASDTIKFYTFNNEASKRFTFYNDIKEIKDASVMDFANTAGTLVCIATGHRLNVWDIEKSICLAKYDGDPEAMIRCMRFSPNDDLIIGGTDSKFIFVWEWKKKVENDATKQVQLRINDHTGEVISLQISKCGKYIFSYESINGYHHCFLFELNNNQEPLSLAYKQDFYLKTHISSEFFFDDSNNKIKMTSFDNFIWEFNFSNKQLLNNPNQLQKELDKDAKYVYGKSTIFIGCYSVDHSLLAKYVRGYGIHIFETNKGQPYQQIHFELQKNTKICAMAISKDNSKLAVFLSNEFNLYDIKTAQKKTIQTFPKSNDITIAKNYKKYNWITGNKLGEILIWEFEASDQFKSNIILQKIQAGSKKPGICLFSLDKNEEYLVSGDENGRVLLWNLNSRKELKELQKENEIEGMNIVNAKFIKENRCVISNNKGFFRIFKLNASEEPQYFMISYGNLQKIEAKICDFDISFDDKIVVVSYEDGHIATCSLENFEINEYHRFFNYECRGVRSIEVFFISDFKVIARSKENMKIINMKPHKSEIKSIFSLQIVTKHGEMISLKENSYFEVMNIYNRSKKDLLQPENQPLEDITSCFLSIDHTKLVAYNETSYALWSLVSGNFILSNKFPNNDVKTLKIAYEKKNKKTAFIINPAANSLYLWAGLADPFDSKNQVKLNSDQLISKLLKNATNIDISYDDTMVLLESENQKIFLFDRNWENIKFKSLTETAIFVPNAVIYLSKFAWNNNNIFSVLCENESYYVVEWDHNTGQKIKSIKATTKIDKMIVTEDNNLFLLNSLNFLELFSTKNETYIYLTEHFEKKIENFYMIEGNNLVLYLFEKNEEERENEEENEEEKEGFVQIYYDFYKNPIFFNEKKNNLLKLFEPLEKNMDNQKSKRVSEILIHTKMFPFNYNFLQILAYSSEYHKYADNIFELFRNKNVNKIPFNIFFQRDLHERNCFDIAFMNKDIKLFKDFLIYIMDNFQIQDISRRYREYLDSKFFNRLFLMFEGHLIINKFFDFVYSQPMDFPEDFQFKRLGDKVIYETYTEPTLSKDQLRHVLYQKHQCKDSSTGKNELLEIVKAKCFYPYEFLDYNSKETQELFKIVSNFDRTNPIFKHEALQNILNYKWESYGRDTFFKEAGYFLLFLLLYILNSDYFFVMRQLSENETLDIHFIYSVVSAFVDVVVIIFILRLLYQEIKQLRYFGWRDYFNSFWNYNDVVYIVFSLVATFLDFLCCFNVFTDYTTIKCLQSFAIFSAFFRMLSYARGVEESSFMVKLIIEVIIDIKYFLLIMIIFIFSLSCSVYVLQSTYTNDGFDSFDTFFREMLGDLNDLDDLGSEVDTYWVFYLFFLAASLVLYITMLNLLIAIINDTFNKVKSEENVAKTWEKWNIITEIDIMRSGAEERMIVAEEKKKEKKYLMSIFNDKIEDNTLSVEDLSKSLEKLDEKLTINDQHPLNQKLGELEKNMKDISKEMRDIKDGLKQLLEKH